MKKVIWNITKRCGFHCSICATQSDGRRELSYEEKREVFLNTNYIIEFSLAYQSNPDSQLAYETFDGSATYSNLVDLYFEFDSGNDILE